MDAPGGNQISGVFLQDIQVMLLVGLGLLLAFMKLNGLRAVAYNFLLPSFSSQWASCTITTTTRYTWASTMSSLLSVQPWLL